MTFLAPPPRRHECNTPGGPRSPYYEPDTLWRCHRCGRWWFAVDGPQVTGNVVWEKYTEWYPVRRWHRKLRKRIAEKPAMKWGGGELRPEVKQS